MHAIILAAGKGTRMKDLAKDTPKPLLLYKGKTLLHHKLDVLPDSVEDIIVVVGYLGEKIVETLGHEYKGKKITYVWEPKLLGTGYALWETRPHVRKKFLVLMGDDIYDKKDLEKLTTHEHAILAHKISEKRAGGKCILDTDGNLISITEDPDGALASPLVYTGACVMTPVIFSLPLVQIPNRKEFGLPQTFTQLIPKEKISVITASFWKQITAPEDLE